MDALPLASVTQNLAFSPCQTQPQMSTQGIRYAAATCTIYISLGRFLLCGSMSGVEVGSHHDVRRTELFLD